MKKKILILGASHFQLPAIKYAKDSGYYVITADYLPNNPGHKLADECHNISTTDKDKILILAKSLKIDGIVAYASDPSALTAAYVSGLLNLPGNDFKTIKVLTNKDLFRKFLKTNGYNVPNFKVFNSFERILVDDLRFPLIVKPVDSSGSKGISKIYRNNVMKEAIEKALTYSRAGKVIIEEIIDMKFNQIHGNGFIAEKEITFIELGDHFFGNSECLTPI